MSDNFLKGNITYFFRAWVDYLFRRRLPGLWVLHLGVLLLLGLLAGFAVDASIPTSDGLIKFSFTTEGAPNWLYIGCFGTAALLVVMGVIWTDRELREQSRKRIIVIELRGLRDMSGCPLADAVPKRLLGRREQLLINLRQGQDGAISEPRIALRRVASLPNDLATREAGLDRADISYVLGGLAPVPLSFLAGVLTDDECAITLMDWNRHHQRWSELDASDDEKRFNVQGIERVLPQCAEVALTVSVSYAVDVAGVAAKLPGISIVAMSLDDGNPDAHWSEEKQMALGRQFLESMIAIGNKGVRTVHLFLAAPNSLVLRFGRLYDKRNLPSVIVYQYERQQVPPYPWAIKMPVEGRLEPELVT